jgi:hypothetical protein
MARPIPREAPVISAARCGMAETYRGDMARQRLVLVTVVSVLLGAAAVSPAAANDRRAP